MAHESETESDALDDDGRISRRRVLGGAAVAGATMLAGGVSGVARAAAAAATTTGLPDPAASGIEHIVVVMMENRSFDHFLGWLPGAHGVQAGLNFLDKQGVSHPTWHLDTFQGLQYGDPDHSYEGGRTQLNGDRMDGWLKAGTDDLFPIGYYLPEDLAFYSQAAPYWTVCDRYHAAIMGPTYPNRLYLHTAQTDRISNTPNPSKLPTIWDSLANAGVSATYYYSDAPFILIVGGGKYLGISQPYLQFVKDCFAGTLPAVSYVDPRFIGEDTGTAGDDHPFADVRVGQAFLNQVYEAVTGGPDWESTVLVITYDEWGGFFDHVIPHRAPDNDRSHALRGFRVPTFVISPRAIRGQVAHGLYDHTSILKMIEWRFGLSPLTPRDAAANNLAEVLDFTNPPDLTAPTWSVPLPSEVQGQPSGQAPTEHEQMWLDLMDAAAGHGFPV